MAGARQGEALAGRLPFMPRKALAHARAALRFAPQANGEGEAIVFGATAHSPLAKAGGPTSAAGTAAPVASPVQ